MLCQRFLRPTLFLCASVAHTLAVRSKLPATPRKRMSPAKVATTLAVTATGAVFVNYKMAHAAAAAPKDALMAQGLFYSFLALCGNTAAALLRKQVSRGSSVRPAEQVGLATAIQGVAAVAYCYSQGLLGTAVAGTFLLPAVGSSVLNALTKTLETKAYARAAKESEIPNFKGSYLGRFPLVSADFWTSDHLSERSPSVDVFSGTRARGTLTLKRR